MAERLPGEARVADGLLQERAERVSQPVRVEGRKRELA